MTPQLYIVNDFDCPCERLIAEERDKLLYYIAPEMQKNWHDRPMGMEKATKLEDFGILYDVKAGILAGALDRNASIATYHNDRPRKWQGSAAFTMPYPPKPQPKKMNVLDLFSPLEERSDEMKALYELLDTQECFHDPAFSIAVCEEMESACNFMIARIQAAMEETPPNPLEGARFSRD